MNLEKTDKVLQLYRMLGQKVEMVRSVYYKRKSLRIERKEREMFCVCMGGSLVWVFNLCNIYMEWINCMYEAALVADSLSI